ncbi:MAG: cobaltochelatase subunit CobN [Gemmatales bacterium]|nr:MAG: cobaltochelatase subunit CobN [Gemmatales bacterium]
MSKERVRVLRTDGKPIHLFAKRAHLMVCAKGCCCGRTERGHAAVPIEFYKAEYKRRRLRRHVHMSMNGCLGPCPLANVVLLYFEGKPIWFQSINSEAQIVAIFDYLETLLASDQWLPPPPELAEYVFNYYGWSSPQANTEPSILAPTGPAKGILVLTHADTDLLTLHHARAKLSDDFPPVRAISLSRIGGAEHMKAVLSANASVAAVIVVRVLGDMKSIPGWKQLIDSVKSLQRQLIVISGTGRTDPEMVAASTVPPAIVEEVAAYFHHGGVANACSLLRFLADHFLRTGFGYDPPVAQPEHGIYHPDFPTGMSKAEWQRRRQTDRPTIGLLFYRSHWMSGNLDFVDSFIEEAERNGANALAVFTTSLKDHNEHHVPAAFQFFYDEQAPLIDVLITTVAFASGDDPVLVFGRLDVPVVQAICSGGARWQWQASPRGLNPLDTAMNVALPELDGRIITVPVSFKEPLRSQDSTRARAGIDAVFYTADRERIRNVVGQALRLARLRRQPNRNKRICFVLTNSPGKAARIGNAVGLDAPASLLRILCALRSAGYEVGDLPENGDQLIHALIDRGTYDEEHSPIDVARAIGTVSAEQYRTWFDALPQEQRQKMVEQWGEPPGKAYAFEGRLAFAGLELGNVLVALQPPRGYGMDPDAIYHRPDLPPTHHYYGFYRWIRDIWRADAIVHLGKHGTLEWLPGKSLGLSSSCFPDSFLADLPLFYPFILNDPGEGAQAKRRGHAVIVDHLMPPMTTADAYGPISRLMQLVDEYYQVESLDPSKLPLVQRQIWDLIKEAHLEEDLKFLMTQSHGDHTHEWDEGETEEGTPISIAAMQGRDVSHLVEELDGYLCELAGAQIRDGLHILGQVPEGDQLVNDLKALTRVPNLDIPSLPGALAEHFGLQLERLTRDPGRKISDPPARLLRLADRPIVTCADILEVLDELAEFLLEVLQRRQFQLDSPSQPVGNSLGEPSSRQMDRSQSEAPSPDADLSIWQWAEAFFADRQSKVYQVLHFLCSRLVPALRQTEAEISNLLHGLQGGYVPPGPSGAPTRGLAHILPTGRNFYGLDPRAVPSPAAWEVGQQLAREVIERYRRETGTVPESVGMSIWGTSCMRTHGDDVAQILALWGVRPVWQQENRRVVSVEVIPLEELGRPRIDVVVRISGFFRDAFPHLIQLLDDAVKLVIARDEPDDENFVRKHYLRDLADNLAEGMSRGRAKRSARYRLFGSKPGSYGAGILHLIDQRHWHDDADFAETYVNWGGYAYTADEQGVDARDAFRRCLRGVEVALHNQDNREHDILDSDDYFQFHGGMIATIRSLTGAKPKHYFGDSHNPAQPVVRDLKEEMLRVFRSRVVNPKWLESITRHGYKGGLELAATVDYLFGYDATTGIVDDWMYEETARRYALDPELRKFLEQSNPWALHAICERLIEAMERNLWSDPDEQTRAALEQILLSSEALLEMRGEPDHKLGSH